ncbi:hypothetical protein FRZ03_18645 [Streptomyces misionensis]|uniref:Uncharacterized protein n=1 Tax=Streptomyces misionensis TaxID=67331 RepID=A0A5C6JS63_9ACTN|nr:hypothetical protein [Streptomyces misionensis]TWV43388.1 hypothetical protein FRZ03_18645 [Streptomyces misionensis]
MSDAQQIPEAMPAEPSNPVLAQVEREYSEKLARAELKGYAAQAGITLPDGFTDYLDGSKLLGEDGKPSADAMDKALAPFRPKEPTFPHLVGAGPNRSGGPLPERPRVSLDVRKR